MNEKGVATLDRALAILAAFSAAEPALSLAELSRRTGLYKSTLLRLLASLENFGYVGQHEDGSYHVGPSALRLANLYQRSIKPAELINAGLRRLVQATTESATFYVRRGDARVVVYREDSPHAVRHHALLGDIFPLNRGAAGKVLRAFAPEHPNDSDLVGVRERYVAVSHGEHAADLSAVSAPVFGIGDRIEGAITLTGPSSRFTPDRIAQMEALLLDTVAELTKAFGGDAEGIERARRLLPTTATASV
jgi:DNA-binding IclR family transcriptional regulator